MQHEVLWTYLQESSNGPILSNTKRSCSPTQNFFNAHLLLYFCVRLFFLADIYLISENESKFFPTDILSISNIE
jgi:hypothetical protein